jgi:hypothetical protein
MTNERSCWGCRIPIWRSCCSRCTCGRSLECAMTSRCGGSGAVNGKDADPGTGSAAETAMAGRMIGGRAMVGAGRMTAIDLTVRRRGRRVWVVVGREVLDRAVQVGRTGRVDDHWCPRRADVEIGVRRRRVDRHRATAGRHGMVVHRGRKAARSRFRRVAKRRCEHAHAAFAASMPPAMGCAGCDGSFAISMRRD